MEKPTLKKNVNLEELKEVLTDYINQVETVRSGEDADLSEYEYRIFESAVIAFFGNEGFDFVNNIIQ